MHPCYARTHKGHTRRCTTYVPHGQGNQHQLREGRSPTHITHGVQNIYINVTNTTTLHMLHHIYTRTHISSFPSPLIPSPRLPSSQASSSSFLLELLSQSSSLHLLLEPSPEASPSSFLLQPPSQAPSSNLLLKASPQASSSSLLLNHQLKPPPQASPAHKHTHTPTHTYTHTHTRCTRSSVQHIEAEQCRRLRRCSPISTPS